jgi:aromatic ring-opening dioxygenase LigB subunit
LAALVLGIGTSHGSMLSTPPREWDGRAGADRRNQALAFRGGTYSFDRLYALRQAEGFAARITVSARQAHYDRCQRQLDALGAILAAARPDVMLIVGDDQHEWFSEELQPTFGVYCAEEVTNFAPTEEEIAHHTREGRGPAIASNHPPVDQRYPIAKELAERIIGQAMTDGFDVAAIMAQPKDGHGTKNLGHAYGFIYRRLLHDRAVPLVPVLINTFYPPNQPSPRRCFDFGRSIGRAVAAWPGDARVVVVGSGGLSHFVIDEEFDRRILDAFQRDDVAAITGEDDALFRSGTSETKNWIVARGALAESGFTMKLLDYVPCYRSEAGTGNAMAFATWSSVQLRKSGEI